MPESSPRRVCFVGIDGATWKIIDPMVKAGKLPNLAAMMENGTRGNLLSTQPPNSSLAWTSFQTGVHPGKHGVFFFREQPEGTYLRPVVSWGSVTAPSIWSLASERGKRVAAVYFPMTYPPESLNGCVIGGLLTPDRSSDFINPPELRDELEQAVGPVPSDNEPEKMFWAADEQAAYECLLETTRQITRVGLHIFESEAWDIFSIVFRGVDLTSHQAWRFQDPDWAEQHPEEAAPRAHVLAEMYELLDEQLGEFRKRCDEHTTIVVASDHGFGPITHRFFVNRWLREKGYLKLHERKVQTMKLRLFLRRKWRGLLRRLGLLRLLDSVRKVRPDDAQTTDTTEMMLMSLVDWKRTRAYSSFGGGEDIVIINRKGRQPEGCVEPGVEYEQLRDEIMGELAQVTAQDGTPLVDRVFRREELWSGPAVERAPDIQFLTTDTAVNASGNPLSPVATVPAYDGAPAMHRMEGVYLMEGKGVVRSSHHHDGPQIADMGPTILHLAGLPVEDYMDGRVIEDALEPAWLADHPVRVESGKANRLEGGRGADSRDAVDEEKVTETLRALGYLD